MDEESRKPLMLWRFTRSYFVRIVIGFVLAVVLVGAICVYVPYQREQRIARDIVAVGGAAAFKSCGPNWVPISIQNRLRVFDRIDMLELVGDTAPLEVFRSVGSLTCVSDLAIVRTRVVDDKLEQLQGLVSITSLHLSDSQVTDVGMQHLATFANLKYLNLGNTRITDAGLARLKGMTALSGLVLDNTQITDAGLIHFTGLTELFDLSLVGTQLTDTGLEHLQGLTSLLWLHLEGTKTTIEGRASLRQALPNCEIWPHDPGIKWHRDD